MHSPRLYSLCAPECECRLRGRDIRVELRLRRPCRGCRSCRVWNSVFPHSQMGQDRCVSARSVSWKSTPTHTHTHKHHTRPHVLVDPTGAHVEIHVVSSRLHSTVINRFTAHMNMGVIGPFAGLLQDRDRSEVNTLVYNGVC